MGGKGRGIKYRSNSAVHEAMGVTVTMGVTMGSSLTMGVSKSVSHLCFLGSIRSR